MHRTLVLALAGLAGLLLLLPTSALLSQEQAGSLPVSLRVLVPGNAELLIEGVRTKQTGEVRRFQSPPLAVGQTYVYTVKATWVENGQEKVAEKKVQVRPGQETVVDLRSAQAAVVQTRATEDPGPQVRKRPKLDVPFVPTPQVVVNKMLELAGVTKEDVVYDLGCGDGRIVVTAAKKYGARGMGVDLDPERVKDSLANVKKEGVEQLVEIREGNVLSTDVSQASVVTLYLFPEVNLKLRPTLQKQLKPGSRIVSHDFNMGDWKPLKEINVQDEDGVEHTLYLWIIGQEAPKDQAPGQGAVPRQGQRGELATLLAQGDNQDVQLDVPYVPTPQDVVEKMLELAEVKKGDVVYDLGCGDGRIVVTAAKKYGARGMGIDLDPERVKDSLANVKKEGVGNLVEIRHGDALKVDVSPATVVTLYLLPEVNLKLRPTLQKQLKPGSRIVSHDFDMDDWQPLKRIEVQSKEDRTHTLYLWKIGQKPN